MKTLTELYDKYVPLKDRLPQAFNSVDNNEYLKVQRKLESFIWKHISISVEDQTGAKNPLAATALVLSSYKHDASFNNGLIYLGLNRLLDKRATARREALHQDWDALKADCRNKADVYNSSDAILVPGYCTMSLNKDRELLGRYDDEFLFLLESLKREQSKSGVFSGRSEDGSFRQWLGTLMAKDTEHGASLVDIETDIHKCCDLIDGLYNVSEQQIEHDRKFPAEVVSTHRSLFHLRSLSCFPTQTQTSIPEERLAHSIEWITERLELLDRAFNSGRSKAVSGDLLRPTMFPPKIIWLLFMATRTLDVDMLCILANIVAIYNTAGDVEGEISKLLLPSNLNIVLSLNISHFSNHELQGLLCLVDLLVYHLDRVVRSPLYGSLNKFQPKGLNRVVKAPEESLQHLRTMAARTVQAQHRQDSRSGPIYFSLLHSPLARLLISLVDKDAPCSTVVEWPFLSLYNVLKLKNRSDTDILLYLSLLTEYTFKTKSAGPQELMGLASNILYGTLWYQLLRGLVLYNEEQDIKIFEDVYKNLRTVMKESLSSGLPVLGANTKLTGFSVLSVSIILDAAQGVLPTLVRDIPPLRVVLLVVSLYLYSVKGRYKQLTGSGKDPFCVQFEAFVVSVTSSMKFTLKIMILSALNLPYEEKIANVANAISSELNRMEAVELNQSSSNNELALCGSLDSFHKLMDAAEEQVRSCLQLLTANGDVVMDSQVMLKDIFKKLGELFRQSDRVVLATLAFYWAKDIKSAIHMLTLCMINPIIFNPEPRNSRSKLVQETQDRVRQLYFDMMNEYSNDIPSDTVKSLQQLCNANDAMCMHNTACEEDILWFMESEGLAPLSIAIYNKWRNVEDTLGIRLLDLYTTTLFASFRKGFWEYPERMRTLSNTCHVINNVCESIINQGESSVRPIGVRVKRLVVQINLYLQGS